MDLLLTIGLYVINLAIFVFGLCGFYRACDLLFASHVTGHLTNKWVALGVAVFSVFAIAGLTWSMGGWQAAFGAAAGFWLVTKLLVR